MVDISAKPPIKRVAVAEGEIHLQPTTIEAIQSGRIKKGDPLAVSQVAAINAVKNTPTLIPLCHQIPITKISFEINVESEKIKVSVKVETIAQTGVEMEALIGVSVFLNNIWDMTKYLEKDPNGQYPTTKISNIRVISKQKIPISNTK
ncbi:MAG: cyclic pyranopterin monophosphate synthase MoaC [Promethearchaeia archaeon]|nr:MAG: cyclic pyranopterin monophosphate synthase MoaC [Candidatus Lokiarchaeia archaeon]